MVARKKVAKKKASTKTAVARSTGTEVALAGDWQEKLAAMAVKEVAKESGGDSSNITWPMSGGSFQFKGAEIGEEFSCIIIDSVYVNQWYDRKYDKENPMPPACIAIADFEEDLKPFHNCPDKQAESCDVCEFNEFGSADNGKGKKCQNRRRLIVVDEKCEEDVASMSIPPSSLRNYAKYVKSLNREHQRPVFGVVTTISFDPDVDYAMLEFRLEHVITDADIMEHVVMLRESSEKEIRQAPDFSNYEPPPKPKARGRARR